MDKSFAKFTVLFIVALHGCRNDEACNPADSPALCNQVQKCFASDASPVVCREAEQDALRIAQPGLADTYSGASKALTY